jgi:nicotinate-nucleotide adenylyltransferase
MSSGSPAQDESPRERIAFFGGSFDPPHNGHLAAARTALRALRLDRVLFAPVGAQPLKPSGATASFDDRVEMTRLAIAGEPAFELSLLDAPRPNGEPNYTLDSLRALHARFPYAQLFLIVGADSFAQLRNWRGAAEIPFAASLIVASRPGQFLGNLSLYLPASITLTENPAENDTCATTGIELRAYTLINAAGESAAFYLLPGLDVPISASEIRNHSARDSSGVLPDTVAAYIREHNLYREPSN